MAHTFEVAFSLGAALQSGFKASIGQAVTQVNKLGNEVRSLGKTRQTADKFAAMTTRIEATRVEMARARERVRELKKEFQAAEKPTKTLTRQMEAAQNQSKRLKTRWKEQKSSLQALKSELEKSGVSTRNLTQEQDRLTRAYDRAKKSRERLGALTAKQEGIRNRRADLRGRMIDAVAPVAALTVPVKAAIDFESEMADVKKVVDPKAFEGLGKEILALSTQIPMAFDGLAKITAAAGQSGLAQTKAELIDFARTAATMGVAFDMAGGEAGSMMAAWRSGMNLSQEQAVGLADAVNHLSNKMNAQAGPLGEVLQRQGAVAKSAGLTEIQTASLAAALLSGGAAPQIAATAMKNLTGALTKGKAATRSQSEAFAALGLDAVDMATMMQQNAPAAIQSVFQALKQAPKEEQSALISQLFGEESKGAIAPLLENLDNLGKAFDLTSDKLKYAGSMQEEYEVRSKTTANSLALLRNQGARLGISLGTVLLPGINSLVAPIGAVMDKAAWLAETFPNLTAGVIGVGAGLAVTGLAINAGAYAFTFYSGAVTRAKIIMAAFRSTTIGTAVAAKVAAAAQWVWNAALSANPIGLVIGGVVALGAAALALRKYWEPIKGFFKGIWAGFSAGIKPVYEAVKPLFAIFEPLSPVVRAVGSAFGWVAEKIGQMASWFGSLLTPVDASAESVDRATAAGKRFGQAIGGIIQTSIDLMKSAFLNFTPMGWVIQAFNPVKNWLSNFNLYESGKKIMGTLADGIKSMIGVPKQMIGAAFEKVRGLLPFSDAKEGPLSALTQSGRAVMDTLGAGITQGQGELYQKFKAVTGTVAGIAAGAGIALSPGPAGGGVQANPTLPDLPRAPASVTVNFNPTIHITGNASDHPGQAKEEVSIALALSEQRLRKVLEEMIHNDRRVSYA